VYIHSQKNGEKLSNIFSFGRDKVENFSHNLKETWSPLLGKINFKHKKIITRRRTMSKKIIQLNEGIMKEDLGEMVRQSVEDRLNSLLTKKQIG
jgi:hypothetical protein